MKFNLAITLLLLFNGGYTQVIPCSKMPDTAIVSRSLVIKPVGLSSPRYYSWRCNITDSIRRRLLYLLHWKWTASEIKTSVVHQLQEEKQWAILEVKAQKITYADSTRYQLVLDSIIDTEIPGRMQAMKEGHTFVVNRNLILAAGHLGMKEAIPLLMKGLSDTVHYPAQAVALTLAKLGHKPLQNKLIAACTYDASLNGKAWLEAFSTKGYQLLFMATQRSIAGLAVWLDSSKMHAAKSTGKIDTKSAIEVLFHLSQIIVNKDFHKLLDEYAPHFYDFGGVTGKMIEAAKQWMLANKGRYIINRDYCPY